MDKEKQNICKNDLDESIECLNNLINLVTKQKEDFLKIKLSFTGLLGIILTIVFNNLDNYNDLFIMSWLVITISAFLLFIDDLWCGFNNLQKNIAKFELRSILLNIRHAASIIEYPRFEKYGVEAEKRLAQGHKIGKMMRDGKSIDEIIKAFSEKRGWKLDLLLWALLFLFVPVLFLLLHLGLLV